MSKPPDAELLGKLLDEVGPALALYASQWTNDPDCCVQEALIELARQPTTPDSPAAWLYRVVKRRALNAVRGEQRRRAREAESLRRKALFNVDDSQTADILAAVEILEQLEGPLREAVVLRLWGGLTFAEAAQTMGVSTATVQRYYQQAVTQLRELWSEPCPTKQDPTDSH